MKLLKNQISGDMEEFDREIQIMSQLRNQFIVQFIGGCMQPDRFSIVTEVINCLIINFAFFFYLTIITSLFPKEALRKF